MSIVALNILPPAHDESALYNNTMNYNDLEGREADAAILQEFCEGRHEQFQAQQQLQHLQNQFYPLSPVPVYPRVDENDYSNLLPDLFNPHQDKSIGRAEITSDSGSLVYKEHNDQKRYHNETVNLVFRPRQFSTMRRNLRIVYRLEKVLWNSKTKSYLITDRIPMNSPRFQHYVEVKYIDFVGFAASINYKLMRLSSSEGKCKFRLAVWFEDTSCGRTSEAAISTPITVQAKHKGIPSKAYAQLYQDKQYIRTVGAQNNKTIATALEAHPDVYPYHQNILDLNAFSRFKLDLPSLNEPVLSRAKRLANEAGIDPEEPISKKMKPY
mmetsp:Transcript_12826/g.20768  ORF Transcript_12826/g.20768 Transcript_12826/m.20768 type:complete len:326 (+) Transcript_12826:301-1278(+)